MLYRNLAIAAGVVLVLLAGVGVFFFGSSTEAQSAGPAPLTDIAYGTAYEIVRVEPFLVDLCPNGRAVSFFFADHNVRSQYICETDVNEHTTEIRRRRTVNRTLTYSTVIFYRMSDPSLEGMTASNSVVTRYVLDLRRPLVPVRTPRPGRAARS